MTRGKKKEQYTDTLPKKNKRDDQSCFGKDVFFSLVVGGIREENEKTRKNKNLSLQFYFYGFLNCQNI